MCEQRGHVLPETKYKIIKKPSKCYVDYCFFNIVSKFLLVIINATYNLGPYLLRPETSDTP